MARGRPKKGLAPDGVNLNGWRSSHAERAKVWAQRASRAARRRALERGQAVGLMEPFSKRLTADTQAAIAAFLAKKRP